ncbi:MAG: hypothetical protein PWQ95_1972 [Thermococcaceae archaeon]|nr:hypothetical protein [Thermococcaceae archaeon]
MVGAEPFPDVGGGTYPLLDFTGSVYLDGKEIRTLNSVRDGTTLTVGTTQVVDEFDWPLTVGTHNITLKIRNTSGLPQYETTKTDNIVVRVLPLEYPLKLVSVSCSDLHFNFEASDYYTKGSYVSPLECTLSFENNVKTTMYIKELRADISVSPPDLKEAIPSHISIPINKNIGPGKIITIRIQETASTDDGQLLLRVDGTMVTLYIDYTIEGMIKEVNKVIGEGVLDNTVVVRVNTRVVWADYGYEGVTLFISFLKLSKVSKVARVAEATGKIGGALTILNKLTEIPNIPKNIFLEIINNL